MAKEGHRCKNADHLDSARSITMETRKWAFNDITGALAMSRVGRGNWLGSKDLIKNTGKLRYRLWRERCTTLARQITFAFGCDRPINYRASRLAASASSARVCSVSRNFLLWPKKSPSAVKLAIVATAPPNLLDRGRMTETGGRLGLMNSQGTGKIRLG